MLKGYDTLHHLGNIRDGLLVIGASLYFVGYATWSLHSWWHSLGTVRVLDAQYFAISLPVAAALSIAILFVAVGRRITTAWHGYYRSRSVRMQWVITVGIVAVIFTAMSAPVTRDPYITPQEWVQLLSAILGIILLDAPDAHPLPQYISQFLLVIFVSGALLFGLVWYVANIYIYIPQEFGGGRPREALLELKVDEISPQLKTRLSTTANSNAGVIQTRKIWVITATSDSIIIAESSWRVQPRVQYLELSRAAVKSIVWIPSTE